MRQYLVLLFVICVIGSNCSPSLKDDGMTDEDYIKINVRWGYGAFLSTVEKNEPGKIHSLEEMSSTMGNELLKGIKLRDEITKQYGYSPKALAKKYDEVHRGMNSYWILSCIEKLKTSAMCPELQKRYGTPCVGGNREPIEDTEDGWQRFFIDNEDCLKAN